MTNVVVALFNRRADHKTSVYGHQYKAYTIKPRLGNIYGVIRSTSIAGWKSFRALQDQYNINLSTTEWRDKIRSYPSVSEVGSGHPPVDGRRDLSEIPLEAGLAGAHQAVSFIVRL
jgi:hypothetical protein